MTFERAILILEEVFSTEVKNRTTDPAQGMRFGFAAAEESDRIAIQLGIFINDEMIEIREQQIPILPPQPDVEISESHYHKFAEGVRSAAEFIRMPMVMPADLFITDLLRAVNLQTATAFRDAILSRELRGQVLAAIVVDDFGHRHQLPQITNAQTKLHLWNLIDGAGGIEKDAQASACVLAAERDAAAIPYLIRLLEDWQQRMWNAEGLSWITADERNIDVVLSRILEPLLRSTTSPSECRRLEALTCVGMFEARHEMQMFPWMYKT